jgi:transcriptional regulator with XRE-family HTH domain
MINGGDFLDKIAFNGKTPKAGDYIRAQRKLLNFTLEDLETITQIDKANLSAYENNKKEVGMKVAVKLGVALGLDPQILIETSIAALLRNPDIKEIEAKSKKMAKLKSRTVA